MFPTDFLKFVERYEYYMNCELQIDSREYRGFLPYDLSVYPSGKLGDIRIHFTHTEGEKAEYILERWEEHKQIFNEYMFWVLSDFQRVLPYVIVKKFSEMPINKCIQLTRSMYCLPSVNYTANLSESFVDKEGTIIEEWFDLIGWINGDYNFSEPK